MSTSMLMAKMQQSAKNKGIEVFFTIVSACFAATSFGTLHQFIYTFLQIPLQGVGGNIISIVILDFIRRRN